jgi:hypothetical protein
MRPRTSATYGWTSPRVLSVWIASLMRPLYQGQEIAGSRMPRPTRSNLCLRRGQEHGQETAGLGKAQRIPGGQVSAIVDAVAMHPRQCPAIGEIAGRRPLPLRKLATYPPHPLWTKDRRAHLRRHDGGLCVLTLDQGFVAWKVLEAALQKASNV